jgi:TolB-like protein
MIRRVVALTVLLSAAVVLAASPTLAHAASPTVAVLPFRDLSGQKASVGEAIRESVTSDLKNVRTIRVVERGALDHVLAEQSLQTQRADLDPTSLVKLGKLLGASMMVTGAYQRDAHRVRLTARFVAVETGEIVGTAKVDGDEGDFLRLQDRVTAELLRSAGIKAPEAHSIAARARPHMKSMHAVELYGDAVVEPDDGKRSDLLRQALAEEPGYAYAAADLAALETRMRGYAKTADAAKEAEAKARRAQIAAEHDPLTRARLQIQGMGALMVARRYHEVQTEARAIIANPATAELIGNARVDEMAAFNLLQADRLLQQHDAILRDGELFMKKFPTSMLFSSAQGIVEREIAERRREDEARAKVPEKLAEMRDAQRWNPCAYARIYAHAGQHREAQRLFTACLAVGAEDEVRVVEELVRTDVSCGDFVAARRHLARLDGHNEPNVSSRRNNLLNQIPTDD